METYSDTSNLSAYFRHSAGFYYILTDLKGNITYINPLFQNEFDFFIDEEKYQQAIRDCLKNPSTPFSVNLEIRSRKGTDFTVRWEFFVYSNDKEKFIGIQGIGIAFDENRKEPEKNINVKRNDKHLIQAAIDKQEKERQKIGKELHDNINQHLNTTRLYLEIARDKVTGESFEIIDIAHKDLSTIIKEIRHLSQSLAVPDLHDIGLIESINDICDSLHTTHAFSINFSHRHFSENNLPVNLKLVLFRIIQEQINNIICHANADSIEIRLQSDAEFILLFISDNGKGFDTTDLNKGSGLTNITNHANLFNGQVEINTSPGKGFSLSVVIPSIDIELQEMN